jgi:hypothetical protein
VPCQQVEMRVLGSVAVVFVVLDGGRESLKYEVARSMLEWSVRSRSLVDVDFSTYIHAPCCVSDKRLSPIYHVRKDILNNCYIASTVSMIVS